MGENFRYEKPLLIEMSLQSAAGTTCSTGTVQTGCSVGSCVKNARCTVGDLPTYCANGSDTFGTCSYCNSGSADNNDYSAIGCTGGGMAATQCTGGVVAGYSCSTGSTIRPCICE
jgi:hypothetical protein